MKTYFINLSEGFAPYDRYKSLNTVISFDSLTFNGGEPHITIDTENVEHESHVIITTRINSFVNLGLLAVTVDALRRSGRFNSLFLTLPYFPGARQDKVRVDGEPLTVKVYADMINEMDFSEVLVLDPHSLAVEALVNNCEAMSNHALVQDVLHEHFSSNNMPLIISPDAGAEKKVHDLSQYLYNEGWTDTEVITCSKQRSVATGRVFGTQVHAEDLQGKDCLVVDDICDGGATFIKLAEELKKKNSGKLYLIVTHGIFSRGFKELKKHYTNIYTTNSIVNNYAWDIPEIEKGSEIVEQYALDLRLLEYEQKRNRA